MPSSIYLITGGARSGKSSHAERLCERLCDNPIYLATASTTTISSGIENNKVDDDFEQRILRHQKDRQDRNWTTIEERLHPSRYASQFAGRVVLVDCLTLWLTNFMAQQGAFDFITNTNAKKDEDGNGNGSNSDSNDNNINVTTKITVATEQALESVKTEFDRLTQQWDVTFVFVTNEVGAGTHATSHVARKFVDVQGWFNQHVAARADYVVHMVCGIPNVIKNKLNDTTLIASPNSTAGRTMDTAKAQAAMLDKVLSARKTPMDPKGYFLVKLELNDEPNNGITPTPTPGFIVASFHSSMLNDKGEVCDLQGNKIACCGPEGKKNRPEPMKVWKCRTAKELTTEIFERWDAMAELDMSVGHAAYMGREAQKAEFCLYSGKPFQQN